MYKPYDIKEINKIIGRYSPNYTFPQNSVAFEFWQRSLYQRMISTLVFKLEDSYDVRTMEFFKYCLFSLGFVAVYPDKEYGNVFQPCSIGNELNFFYQPTRALIANPAYKKSKELKIGEECELLQLTPDRLGCWDIINRYAEKLASLDTAIDVSIINLKIPDIIAVKNKAAAAVVEKALDQINKGNPAVIINKTLTNDRTDKSEPWQIMDRGNINSKYITTQQLQDQATILRDFDSEIGITTTDFKRERLIASETMSKEEDATSRLNTWLECLNKSLEVINKHFGWNWSVEQREVESEVEVDEFSETNANRD